MLPRVLPAGRKMCARASNSRPGPQKSLSQCSICCLVQVAGNLAGPRHENCLLTRLASGEVASHVQPPVALSSARKPLMMNPFATHGRDTPCATANCETLVQSSTLTSCTTSNFMSRRVARKQPIQSVIHELRRSEHSVLCRTVAHRLCRSERWGSVRYCCRTVPRITGPILQQYMYVLLVSLVSIWLMRAFDLRSPAFD